MRFNTLVRLSSVKIIEIVMNYYLGFKLINWVFNNSPKIISDNIVRYIKFPEKEFIWKIKLLNNKRVNTLVSKSIKNSWDFALSYKWHDPALSKIENIINSFFNDNKGLFIDVGSNMGLRSLTFLSSNKKCILFEPNIDLHDFNKELFRLNGFTNYELSNLCLSDNKRKEKIFISSTSYMSSLDIEIAKQDDIIDERIVQLQKLDDFTAKFKNEKINYIKIDVEGHELAVIKGANKKITAEKPTVLVEILDKGENRKNICNYFLNLKYKIYEITNHNPGQILYEIFEDNFKNNSTNYLFVHNQRLNYILKNK